MEKRMQSFAWLTVFIIIFVYVPGSSFTESKSSTNSSLSGSLVNDTIIDRTFLRTSSATTSIPSTKIVTTNFTFTKVTKDSLYPLPSTLSSLSSTTIAKAFAAEIASVTRGEPSSKHQIPYNSNNVEDIVISGTQNNNGNNKNSRNKNRIRSTNSNSGNDANDNGLSAYVISTAATFHTAKPLQKPKVSNEKDQQDTRQVSSLSSGAILLTTSRTLSTPPASISSTTIESILEVATTTSNNREVVAGTSNLDSRYKNSASFSSTTVTIISSSSYSSSSSLSSSPVPSTTATSTTTTGKPLLLPHVDKYQNITSQVGTHAYLPCNVKQLVKKPISWLRVRDGHILTVDQTTFIADQRFQSIYTPNPERWSLQIKYVQQKDAGTYECQVSTEPKASAIISLNIVEPKTEMLGESNRHVKAGSQVKLRCIISQALEPPLFINWFFNRKQIYLHNRKGWRTEIERTDEPSAHLGLSLYPAPSSASANEVHSTGVAGVEADERRQTTTASLIIPSVEKLDSGNYTCSPSNSEPITVVLHVLNGEFSASAITSGISSSINIESNHHNRQWRNTTALLTLLWVINFFTIH